MLREGAEKFGSARRRVPGCRRDSGRGIDARFHGGAGRTNLEDVTPYRHLAVAVAGHIAAVDDAARSLGNMPPLRRVNCVRSGGVCRN
jgi:hypothetical protein